MIGIVATGALVMAGAGISSAQARPAGNPEPYRTSAEVAAPASTAVNWQWAGDYDSQWECGAVGTSLVIYGGYSTYSCDYFDGSGKWQLYVG